jgi:hypothetical protein
MLTAPESLTKFINSPPGVLVAGGVLAGIVWKFFEGVDAVLNDATKKGSPQEFGRTRILGRFLEYHEFSLGHCHALCLQ